MDLHVRTGSAVHSPRVPGGGGDGVTPVVGGISSAGPARGPRVRRLDGAGTRGVWARLRRRLRLQWFTVVVVVLGCAAVGLLGWQLAHFPCVGALCSLGRTYSPPPPRSCPLTQPRAHACPRCQVLEVGPDAGEMGSGVASCTASPGPRHVRERRWPRRRRGHVRNGWYGAGAQCPTLRGCAAGAVRYDSMRDEMVRSKVVFEGSAVSTAVKLGKTRFSSRVPLAGAGSGTPSNTAAAGSSGRCRNTVQGRDVLTDEHGESARVRRM